MSAESKSPEKKKPMRMLLSVLIGAVLGILLIKYGKPLKGLSVLFLLPMCFIVIYLQILLHEVGHLITGRLIGFRLLSFRILNLSLERGHSRFVIKFRKNIGYSGLCVMLPTKEYTGRAQSILFFSGGLLMHLLSALVCILVLYLNTDLPQLLSLFVYTNIVLGLSLMLANAIPSTTKGNILSDGKHIWNAIRNNEDFYIEQQLFFLGAKSMAGHRPAELQSNHWDNIAEIKQPSAKVRFLLYGYYHYLDRDMKERAFGYMDEIAPFLSNFPLTMQPNIQSEMLYAAVLRGDKETSGVLFEKLRSWLEKEHSLPVWRIFAAYNWYITGDAQASENAIGKAEAVADRYVIPGFVPFEKAQLAQIRADITQGSVAVKPD